MPAGNLVASLAGIVPDGLLVFFPSYYVLERSIDYWKHSGGGAPYALLVVCQLIPVAKRHAPVAHMHARSTRSFVTFRL